jgi:hypothetical protein
MLGILVAMIIYCSNRKIKFLMDPKQNKSMNVLTLNIYNYIVYEMYLYQFLLITNLLLIFTCKYLGGTLENSRKVDSFENWYLVNGLKFYGGWALSVGIRFRRIFSNFVEVLILFEYFALILVINREKNKTLGVLLF